MWEILRGPSLVSVTKMHHGLGNRVRAVLGCQVLAELEGREFAYVWPVGKPFGAGLDELWEFDHPIVPGWVATALSPRYPYRDHDLAWTDGARDQRIWQIRTAHALEFHRPDVDWGMALRRLTPTARISDRILKIWNEQGFAGQPYVGVMVRTHAISHSETSKHSPLSWYVDRLLAVRKKNPDVRFYISADTPEAQREILAAVPGSFGQEDKGGYNTAEALRSAIVDLYLLASAAHIIGPYFSSFPELAVHLSGGRVALESSRTPREQQLVVLDDGQQVNDPLLPFQPNR